MNKHMGPIIYDSLDKPNADKRQQGSHVARIDYRVVTVILFFGTCLLVGLFVYVVQSLRYQAYSEYNKTAVFLLNALNIAVVLAFIGLLFGTVYAVLGWLIRWARKNGILSLHEGPHYDLSSVHTRQYDEVFNTLIDRFYTVMEERAKNSQYHGASTITVSEGDTTTNVVKDEKKEITQLPTPDQLTTTHTMKDLDHENK